MNKVSSRRSRRKHRPHISPIAKSTPTGEAEQTAGSTPAGKSSRKHVRWEWNLPLLFTMLGVLLVVGVLSGISYFYHSKQIASTLLERADAAAAEQNFADQARWLAHYTLLRPDDQNATIQVAIASDTAADFAERESVVNAVNSARRRLSDTIAQLDSEHADEIIELRRRLIKRLLQLGGDWNREAERHVMLLDASPEDAEVTRWLGLALYGQLRGGIYRTRLINDLTEQDNYWEWLAAQQVGDVLVRALERGSDDLDLYAAFLDVYANDPELFQRSNDQEIAEQGLEVQMQRVVAALEAKSDGRSKLVLVQFHVASGDEQRASELILTAAADAASRLDTESLAERGEEELLAGELPAYYWDYLLLADGAVRLADDQPDTVTQWFDQLISLQLPVVPITVVERVHRDAGLFHASLGDNDQAIKIWEDALESVNPNSLELAESVVSLRAATPASEEYSKALKRFSEQIEATSLAFSSSDSASMNQAQRAAKGRQIERSRWKLLVFESLLAINEERPRDAIRLLNSALTSTTDIDLETRISAAKQLAVLYRDQGLWDKAAETLERAIDWSPQDAQLQLLASDAWRQTGNQKKAMQHWRAASNAASLQGQLAGIESAFNYQLQLVPEQREFSEVRTLISRIEDRLSQQLDDDDEQMATTARRLDILKILLPPRGVSVEEHWASAAMANAIVKLAQTHPQNQAVQLFAAERLTELDRPQDAEAALQRLSSIVGETDSSLAYVKARIASVSGKPLEAAQTLIEQSQRDSENAERLLDLAASHAIQADRVDLAYSALEQTPDVEQSLQAMFKLAVYARGLPSDSPALSPEGKSLTPEELSQQWEQRLREAEGEQGTYWRCLSAMWLIDELRNESNRIEENDRRLLSASNLVREILAKRPQWGRAISLQGWLSAIAGNPQRAIGELRAGLAAGDERPDTRLLLVDQLVLMNRWREADDEIRRASMIADVDRYGARRIEMAVRQGDINRSLRLAESGVQQRPDDLVSYVVLCNTARLAAEDTRDADQRQQLLAKAKSAIDRAGELATRDEASIFSARLQLALTVGDESLISQEIEKLQASKLGEYTQQRLIGQLRFAQRDYDAARQALERAQEINPTDQGLLELAEVYQRLRNPDDVIGVLRKAYASRPNDEVLANRLARAIVSRDGTDADWNELSKLLSTGTGVTPSNRYLYAFLLAAGGNTSAQQTGFLGSAQQKDEAVKILRELKQEGNSRSEDAARLLAVLLQDRLAELGDGETEQHEQVEAEIQSIYTSLLDTASPLFADQYRYALFLLEYGEDQEAKIAELQREMQTSRDGAVAALNLSLHIEQRDGAVDGATAIVDSWVKTAVDAGLIAEDDAASVAASVLLKLDLVDPALQWLDRAYRKNPEKLPNYAAALIKHDRISECIDLCANHFEAHGDVASVVLLVDSLIADDQTFTASRHQAIITSALKKFEKHPELLEGIATLLMKQQNYGKAVAFYQQALAINPRRIRALNNLALTLSELPGRQAEGIEPVERAIQLIGDNPELLDTKGLVLLRAGRLADARATFEQAIAANDEPRYQFHLIVTLLAQKQEDDARRLWGNLKLQELDRSGLMPSELVTLKELQQKFGPAGKGAAL